MIDEFDFICLGGGLGGLAGAIRARALGLSCLVLEKSPLMGGVAAYGGGDLWAPMNHLARDAGITDSRDAAMTYIGYVGGEGVPFSPQVRAAYVDTVAEAVEFYATTGKIAFTLLRGGDAYFPHGPGSTAVGRSVDVTVDGAELGDWYELLRESPYFPTGLRAGEQFGEPGDPGAGVVSDAERASRIERKFLGRGRGLAGGFLKSAIEHGVTLRPNAHARSLVYDGARVTGVTVEIAGDVVECRARAGVLLATGGYGYAPYAAALEGLPEFLEQSPPIVDGDAIALIESTPATVIRAGFGYYTLGYRSTTDVHPGTDEPLMHPILEALGKPHVIVVNSEAQRYGDESVYTTFQSGIGAFDSVHKRYRNLPTYAILDDQFRRSGYEFGWGKHGCWPTEELTVADTLGGLALALGLDPTALETSVAHYNRSCRSGMDEMFHRGDVPSARRWGDPGRENPNLGTIELAPFWGVRCSPVGAGICSHGLAIDENASVLSAGGDPISGLYATGNAVAYVEMPGGYQSGVANGRNVTYAYVAATHAATRR